LVIQAVSVVVFLVFAHKFGSGLYDCPPQSVSRTAVIMVDGMGAVFGIAVEVTAVVAAERVKCKKTFISF
jgi:hypothetical protein